MKHRTPLRKRLLCSLLTVLLVGITPLSVSAETLEEIQAQQDQLQAENQELQSKLDNLREDEAQSRPIRIRCKSRSAWCRNRF